MPLTPAHATPVSSPPPFETITIPRRTWDLAQLETHNLRQLMCVVLMNCQLAELGRLPPDDACHRILTAVEAQRSEQLEGFLAMFRAANGHG